MMIDRWTAGSGSVPIPNWLDCPDRHSTGTIPPSSGIEAHLNQETGRLSNARIHFALPLTNRSRIRFDAIDGTSMESPRKSDRSKHLEIMYCDEIPPQVSSKQDADFR